ncbi:MAG: SUMF1/EgtB/PvdO family nonheme iron enzyme [Candidatus Eisenbacteria bacterium]|uniref:SUMF1/EgtB/PvdO family nonheme iron enzyme n=1 Tax=Eiseniibacteriota bacterium TaxID=2212470 RepID=A0A937X9P5_UNCEI|nr:SUMF1/EgtB/PvdO family nonheme iron enzyme [Candidatus Eisenbacteria bacterium]
MTNRPRASRGRPAPALTPGGGTRPAAIPRGLAVAGALLALCLPGISAAPEAVQGASPPPGMVWIPAGPVRMGQEGVTVPEHDVQVEGFHIDIHEVSNARYAEFIAAGGYSTETWWHPVGWAWKVEQGVTQPEGWDSEARHGGGVPGHEAFPVNGVSWWEADAYCRWAGRRLPTEVEWEKAAKGGCETHGDLGGCDDADTPTYPWGEGCGGQRANYYLSGDPYERNGWTTPTGYYDGSDRDGFQTIDSPGPYGLYDTSGNVREWCSTRLVPYPYDPGDGREDPPATADECCRVLRGGSWGQNEFGLRCASRSEHVPSHRTGHIGFRCVKSE